MEETVNALTMNEENPHYKDYLKNKDKIVALTAKKRERYEKKRIRKARRKNQAVKTDPFTSDDPYDENEFLFLSFMTRKYFRDGCIFSALKIFFGILALTASIVIIELQLFRGTIRSVVGTLLLFYSVIMIPLSTLYLCAYLICFCSYDSYVSTRTSALSGKIIHFYDKDTDKFVAVNWSNVFSSSRSAYNEKHRMRGW